MVFTCANPNCKHDQFNFIQFNFPVPNNQARSAYAVECSKCKVIQDIIRITPTQVPKQSNNDMKRHINIVDTPEYKPLYENLVNELKNLNLNVVNNNSLGDIKLEPIDPNKSTGLADLNAKLQAKIGASSVKSQDPTNPASAAPAADQSPE